MQDHWREFGPPTYIAVAMYMGLGKISAGDQADEDDADGDFAADMMALAPGGSL